eukprot:4127403-Pleurochrysis_carterae.AAC.1
MLTRTTLAWTLMCACAHSAAQSDAYTQTPVRAHAKTRESDRFISRPRAVDLGQHEKSQCLAAIKRMSAWPAHL